MTTTTTMMMMNVAGDVRLGPNSTTRTLASSDIHHQRTSSQQFYNEFATSQCQSPTYRHVKMLGCGKFLSVGGVRSRCPCSGVWHLSRSISTCFVSHKTASDTDLCSQNWYLAHVSATYCSSLSTSVRFSFRPQACVIDCLFERRLWSEYWSRSSE